MKVLIACEFSGIVRDAFAAKGHDAWSCDLLPTDKPGNHYQCDIRELLTMDWDLMLAYPPCTHLATSGAKWFEQKKADGRQQSGIDFFMLFTKTKIPKVCIENPMGIMSTLYRRPDQKIHPYHFGDPFQKTTCLWLFGLSKLVATHFDAPLFGETVDKGEFYEFKTKAGKKKRQPMWFAKAFLNDDNSDRATKRSFRYSGVAKAMAEQWG